MWNEQQDRKTKCGAKCYTYAMGIYYFKVNSRKCHINNFGPSGIDACKQVLHTRQDQFAEDFEKDAQLQECLPVITYHHITLVGQFE